MALAITLMALGLGLSACRHEPPEQALRRTIADMQRAGEEHRVSDVMDSVAEDFAGPDGMDQKQLQRFLTLISLQNRELGVTLGPMEVKMQGNRAAVAFTLAGSGGSGGWLPDRGQIYDVETGWRLEDGEWRLISANWKEEL